MNEAKINKFCVPKTVESERKTLETVSSKGRGEQKMNTKFVLRFKRCCCKVILVAHHLNMFVVFINNTPSFTCSIYYLIKDMHNFKK